MNFSDSLVPLAVIAAFLPSTLSAASADLQADYAQVRRIALKDPGVRAAYARADAKLNEKILEIDPTLKPIVEKRGAQPVAVAKRSAPKKPLQGAPAQSSTYVVAQGDTLTSIAARYGTTAADLKSANGIVDERKLRVGQRLTIPAKAKTPQRATAQDDGFWSRLKAGL